MKFHGFLLSFAWYFLYVVKNLIIAYGFIMNNIVLFGFLFLILNLPCTADSIRINSINPIHFKHDFYEKNELNELLSSEVELNHYWLFHALDHGEFKQMDRLGFILLRTKFIIMH